MRRQGVKRYEADLAWRPRLNGETVRRLDFQLEPLLVTDLGMVWVGTADGLVAFDPSTAAMQTIRHVPGDPTSLPDNTIFEVIQDSHGHVKGQGTALTAVIAVPAVKVTGLGDVPLEGKSVC